MKYTVEITETLQRQVEVDAETQGDAELKVRRMYRSGEIELGPEYHIDTEFSCIE